MMFDCALLFFSRGFDGSEFKFIIYGKNPLVNAEFIGRLAIYYKLKYYLLVSRRLLVRNTDSLLLVLNSAWTRKLSRASPT